MFRMGFRFLDPGRLVDNELELIAPREDLIDEVLAACAHPLTIQDAPREAALTRERIVDFLKSAPGGREPADPSRGRAPSYHFWMRLRGADHGVPVCMAGGIGLRIGRGPELELYSGHIGYQVYPPARGHHYAERAVRLLLPLARRHALNPLWITCNPDNVASRRTCERLGAEMVEIVSVPTNHEFYLRGEKEKCRYRLATE